MAASIVPAPLAISLRCLICSNLHPSVASDQQGPARLDPAYPSEHHEAVIPAPASK
jgi:hypothetical protein